MEVLKEEPLLYKQGEGFQATKMTPRAIREWAFYLISLQDGLLWAGYARKLRLHKTRRNKEHYSVRFLYTLMTDIQRQKFSVWTHPVFKDYQWKNERLLRAFSFECDPTYENLLQIAKEYHTNSHFYEARSVMLLLAVLQLKTLDEWRDLMVKNRISQDFVLANFAVA